MADLGVGIVGSGFMGRTYAETITKHCPQAVLRAVAGGSRAQQLSIDYGIDFEESLESLVDRPIVTSAVG